MRWDGQSGKFQHPIYSVRVYVSNFAQDSLLRYDVQAKVDAVRGWRKERVARTTDTAGQPIAVTTGLTVDVHDNEVVGLAIDALGPVATVGPSAVLTLEIGSEVAGNLRSSLTDLLQRRGDTP